MATLATSARDLMAQIGERDPDAIAVLFIESSGDRTAVTNERFIASVRSVIDSVGPQPPGRRLRAGLLMRNQPEMPAILLGLLAAGCIVAPINPDSYPGEIEFIIGDAGLSLIIAERARPELSIRTPAGVEFTRIDDVISKAPAGRDAALPVLSAREPSLIMYTSGTTSQPKGVMLSEASLFHNAGLIAGHFGLDGNTQLTTLPMYHAHSFHFGFLSSLLTAGRLIVLRSFDPVLWAETVRTERVDWTSIVPSLLPLLLATGLRRETCPSLRGVLVSSAPINETAARQFEASSGIPIIQGWGQTEYTCWSNVCDVNSTGTQFHGERRSVGPPLPGVVVGVYRSDGSEASELEEGELYLAGASEMLGYLGNEELTRQTLTPRGVRTGDLGYFQTIGGKPCYFVTGRIKEVINRAGEKLSPASIEAAIYARFPQCSGRLAVVGFDHSVIGEEIGIVIDAGVFDEGRAEKDKLIASLKGMHQTYRPRVVLISRQEISKTFTGKIQRTKLKGRFAAYANVTSRFQVVDTSV